MGDLGAYKENVKFSDHDAQAVITACTNAAAAVDGQKGSMASARTTGGDQFKGYFSTLFAANGTTQVKDAGEVSSALRQVAKMAGELQNAADEEQQRRVKARAWEEQQKHRNFLEKGWDDIFGNTPPVGPPAHQLHQAAQQPATGGRETPAPGSGGGASTGTSSAIPDNLRSFATTTSSNDTALTTQHGLVQKALAAFTASCGWGSLNAAGVVTGFQQFIDANKQEVDWANTIATAFETAGGHGSVCTLSNQALGAALAAAHVAASRTDITIDMPSVLGGVPTSGYADDPVNTATGNFIEPETDLAFDGGCAALSFTRMYNSMSVVTGGFGPGWASFVDSGMLFTDDAARWVRPDGRHLVFPRSDDGWDRAIGASFWLTLFGDGFVVSDNAGGRWRFTAGGRLESFDRGDGTRVDVVHGPGGRLVGLVHELGRSLTVEWDGDRVARVTASDGRRVDYGYDERARLISATGPRGTRRYVWGDVSGLLEQVIDGDGVVEALNEYDEQGRVVSQRSPFGRVSRYSYLAGGVTEVADTDGERSNTWIADPAGRLVGVIDSHGYRQSYAWDADGNMLRATDRVGRTTVRDYDDRARLTGEVTATGAHVQYGYDEQDRVITVVAGAADGTGSDAVTTYEYAGDDRNPTVMIDPIGGRTEMEWDRGLLTALTDPTGVVLRFDYDEHGDPVATTNAAGDVARLERDDAGRVIAAVTPSGHRTTYSYDAAGILTERRDPDGAVWRFEHTAAGRLSARVAPDGGRTELEYGTTGEETRSVDPLGRVTGRVLDDLGNVASVRLPDGSTWSYTHDALSRLVQTVDPTGGVWVNRFAPDGALTETVDPTGMTRTAKADRADNSVTVDDGLLSSTVRLDALGRPRSVSAADDETQTYVYDACGNVVEVLDAEGALTRIQRDAAGRPVQLIDPTGVATRYVYDACGRLSQVVAADGGVTTREYDADSRLVRQVLPNGDAAWAEYDPCGRLARVHQPGSGTARYAYDTCGRVVSAADTWWGTRRFAYDLAGQLVAVTNGLGGVTRYDYDENGRVVRITDPAGGITHRGWDAMGRRVSETDQLGRTTTAGYDAAGRQVWQQAPDRRRMVFTYDEAGRVASTSVGDLLVAANTYDLAHRRIVIDDRTGTTGVTHVKEWDRAGRLISHSRGTGEAADAGMTWAYDRAGRRIGMTDAFGRTTGYHYDEAGRLDRVEHPSLGTVVLTHDGVGHIVTATATDGAGRVTTQTWDWLDGDIVAHTTTGTRGDESIRETTVIERDDDGRITAITRDGVTTGYGYDAAGQLTEAVRDGLRQTWTFDLGGRLVRSSDGATVETYGYDPAGQVTTVHHGDGTTTTHEYDEGGERTRTIRADGTVRDYEWLATGWLSGLTETRADGGAETTTLIADALGHLTQAGGNSLWWDTAAAVPTLVGVDDTPILPLGVITGIGDGWTAPGWRATRADTGDPWQVSPAVGLPGGFGLTASGTLTFGAVAGFVPLEWLGARAYDPATQGFLATDPLPPVTGAAWAANPYSYAGNNPLAFTDPTGLHPLSDDELRKQTQGWLAGAWDATTNWVGNNWEYLVAGAAIVGGIALMCTGVGGPAGIALMAASGALLAGGASTAIQKATTGQVNWGNVAVAATIGAVTGGAGAWASGAASGSSALLTTMGVNAASGAVAGEGSYLWMNRDHLTWQGAAGAAFGGGLAGAVAGAAGPAGGTIAKEVFGVSSTGVTATAATAVINFGGGAGGDVASQLISNPGGPVNVTEAAISGGMSSGSGLLLTKGPVAEHIPQPTGTNTLKQLSYFGTRTTSGLGNLAATNTRGLLAGAGAGTGVGAVSTSLGSWLSATVSQ